MALRAGVGTSQNEDAYRGAYEACKTAMRKMGGDTANLVVAFASVVFNQEEVVRGIRNASGKAPLVGCTGAGEITNEGPTQKSISVMAISSDAISFSTGVGKDIKKDARQAGRDVAEDVKARVTGTLRTFMMFPDVLIGNGADIVRGVLDVFGAHFPVVGGAAGDDFLFEKTYQYLNDEVMSGAVVGIGISGKFSMGIGVRHGWIPIGVPMKVTKSEGAVIHELDNRPALSIYEEYFGEEKAKILKKEPLAKMAITYPLGLKVPELDEYLIRDPISADEHGSITCAAEIPQGSEIRLMIGSKEKAVEAAEEAARKLMAEFEKDGTKPKMLLMFNCIAREKLFGQKANEEIQAVMEIIGKEVPLLGFYTYGEQAPIAGEIRDAAKISSRFYNETIVMFALGE